MSRELHDTGLHIDFMTASSGPDASPGAIGMTVAEATRPSFGVENRARLQRTCLSDAGKIWPGEVRKHVYRRLLRRGWRIGLAHWHESAARRQYRPIGHAVARLLPEAIGRAVAAMIPAPARLPVA
jgi:hypothetical protein